MIRHVVMFKLKDPVDVVKLQESAADLAKKIDFIQHLETGVNFAQSERAMDLVLIVDLKDKEDLERYRIHPDHLPVLEMVKQICVETKVVDFEY